MSTLTSAAIALTIRAVSILSQLAFFVFIARETSVSTVGQFALINALWVLSRSLLPLGWNMAVLRRTSVLHDASRHHEGRRLLNIALSETAMFGVTLGAIILGSHALFAATTNIVTVAISVCVGLLWAEIGITADYLRAKDMLVFSQFSDGLSIHVLPLLLCGASIVLSFQLSVNLIVGSYLASSMLALVCMLSVVFRPTSTKQSMQNPERITISRATERQLARRLWWPQTYSALSSRAPVMLAAPVVGVASTAIVETGLRTQLVGATLAWAGGTVASPRYAVAHHDRRTGNGELLSAATWVAFLPTASVAIGLVFFGEELLGFLGEPYADHHWVITLMAIAAVIELPAATSGYFLMMTGRERIALFANAGQLLTLTPLAALLGASFGTMGIAVAVLQASIVRTTIALVGLRHTGAASPFALSGVTLIYHRSRLAFILARRRWSSP